MSTQDMIKTVSQSAEQHYKQLYQRLSRDYFLTTLRAWLIAFVEH